MYNYPVLIHYHRKDEAYQSCNFSEIIARLCAEFVKEQEALEKIYSNQVKTISEWCLQLIKME